MFAKTTTLIVVIMAISIMAAIVCADEITIPVTEYSILSDTISNPRLIVKFALPASMADTSLVFAELSFGITPSYDLDSILQFDCIRITADWSPNDVGWNTPWAIPGGDYDTLMTPTMFATTEVGAQTAYFDITEIVRDWLGNVSPNHGLIFIVPERFASTYVLTHLPELPDNAIASVKIVKQ
jgi:hypothetical protein